MKSNQHIQQMLCFAAVIDAGSFTKAAERLGVAKSSVSKQLHALEQYYGVRLLHRQTRKLRLTEEGRAILPHCRQISQSAREAEQTVAQLKGAVEGVLRVSAIPLVGERLMREFISGFAELYPSLVIQLHTAEDLIDIIEEGFDLALCFGARFDERYVAREMGQVRARLVAAPDYLQRCDTPATIAGLGAHRCLIWEFGPGDINYTWMLEKDGDIETVDIKGSLVANSVTAIKSAAMQGLGIALLPSDSVETEIHQGHLVPILNEYRTPSASIYAVYPQRLQTPPKVQMFLHHVRPYLSF